MMAVRGIRGATTVDRDDAGAILDATHELLEALVGRNAVPSEEIASVLFTVTPDLRAEFPAAAARERLGWVRVPFLNFTEIDVPGSLQRCIRVLIHVNTDARQDEITHVYLRGARVLRPDLCKDGEGSLRVDAERSPVSPSTP